MADKYPEVAHVDGRDTITSTVWVPIHHYIIVLLLLFTEKVHIINKKLAREVATSGLSAVAYFLNDSGGECYGPYAQEAFQLRLKEISDD